METYNPMKIQEEYQIGEKYLFSLGSSNNLIQASGSILEFGITQDNVSYLKVDLGHEIKMFVTNAGKPIFSKEYFANFGQSIGQDSHAKVPA